MVQNNNPVKAVARGDAENEIMLLQQVAVSAAELLLVLGNEQIFSANSAAPREKMYFLG